MSEPENRLRALWAMDLPAGRDPMFALAVLQTIERRRFRNRMLLIAGYVFAMSCALVAALPLLLPLLEGADPVDELGLAMLSAAVLAIVLIETPGLLNTEDP